MIINVDNNTIIIDKENIIISDLIFTCNNNPFLNIITINKSNVSIINNTFYGPIGYDPYTDGLITAIYISSSKSNILIRNNTFYRLTYPSLINNNVYGNILYNNTYYTTGWQINSSGTYNTGIMGDTGSLQNGLVLAGNSWSVPKNKRGESFIDIAFDNTIDLTTYGGTGYISTQNSSANINQGSYGPVYNITKRLYYTTDLLCFKLGNGECRGFIIGIMFSDNTKILYDYPFSLNSYNPSIAYNTLSDIQTYRASDDSSIPIITLLLNNIIK